MLNFSEAGCFGLDLIWIFQFDAYENLSFAIILEEIGPVECK